MVPEKCGMMEMRTKGGKSSKKISLPAFPPTPQNEPTECTWFHSLHMTIESGITETAPLPVCTLSSPTRRLSLPPKWQFHSGSSAPMIGSHVFVLTTNIIEHSG